MEYQIHDNVLTINLFEILKHINLHNLEYKDLLNLKDKIESLLENKFTENNIIKLSDFNHLAVAGRVIKLCKSLNITKWSEFSKYTRHEIKMTRSCGKLTLDEIEDQLLSRYFYFKSYS